MELGTHIQEHRSRLGLSQDDLAARVYVSRQTVSNWERGKTYPDVQSLLILSAVFDVTVDDLIKGDVETMKETANESARTLKRLSYTMAGFLALMLAALGWLIVQMWAWDWSMAQLMPTILLALTLWGIAMAAAVRAEQLKKQHDLITYQEILAFWEGRPVNRDTPAGKRLRTLSKRTKILRLVGFTLMSALIGGTLGYGAAMLVNHLAG